MRNILVAMVLVLSLIGACGGGDVCSRAYNKAKACADKLDCASIADSGKKAACETMKEVYASSYSDAKAACEKANPGQCECTGALKTAAEDYLAATVDPETCSVQGVQGDVCQQFIAAFNTCVENLPDCKTFTDATKKAICDALKNPGTGTGTGTGTVACEGDVKDNATKFLAAGFDDVCMPKTLLDQGI